MGWEDFNGVAAHAKRATAKGGVVAAISQFHQPPQQKALVDGVAGAQWHGHFLVGLDGANAIDAGHAGDDDHVVPLQKRAGGGVAQTIDLFVNGRVFFHKRVGARHIGFRLVIVVIGHEVFHGIVRKKVADFAKQLRGQGLVWGQDQSRAAGLSDDVGHGEGLAGTGDPQ